MLLNEIKLNRIAAIACLLIAGIIAILIPSQTSPNPIPGSRGADMLTGRFFPTVGLFIFTICSLILLISTFQKKPIISKLKSVKVIEKDIDVQGISSRDFLSGLLIVIVLGFGYVQITIYFGYLISTIISMVAISYFIGNRNWINILLISLIVPIVIYLVFLKVLLVPLPEGILIY